VAPHPWGQSHAYMGHALMGHTNMGHSHMAELPTWATPTWPTSSWPTRPPIALFLSTRPDIYNANVQLIK
jgi:hypothetical protein